MLVLFLFLLFAAPVKLTLLWQHGLEVRLQVWGVKVFRRAQKAAPGQGEARLRGMRLPGTVLRADKARRFLFRHVRFLRLQALISPGLQDAAKTALVTGFLRQLAACLPPSADVRVQPNFIGPTRVQARCILFFHLGTIIIAAGMVLAAYLLECREHPAHKPKEA